MPAFSRLIRNILIVPTGASGFLAFAAVFWGAVSRYALNAPAGWTEEVARYTMIYGVMCGVALAWLDRVDIRFAVLENAFSDAGRVWLFRMLDLGMICFGLAFAVSGWLFAGKRGAMISTGLDIPMFWPQLAIAIGGVLIALAGVAALLTPFRPPEPDTLPHLK